MSRPLPTLEIPNPTGSCWSCIEQGAEDSCDQSLPFCRRCQNANQPCAGYHVRLRKLASAAAAGRAGRCHQPRTSGQASTGLLLALSSLGLPTEEDHLIQHFAKNVTRLTMAVDYDGNGYRRFVAVAMEDEALLNALLALSSAHLNQLQQRTDNGVPRRYLRKSLQGLHRRLAHPALAHSGATLMTMWALLLFELCNNGTEWKRHFYGILAWMQSRQDRPDMDDMDDFLVSSVATTALQVLLHSPGPARVQSLSYFDSLSGALAGDEGTIDVMIGYSLDVPRFLIEATRMYEAMQHAQMSGDETLLEAVGLRAMQLKQKVQASRTPTAPRFGLLTAMSSSLPTPASTPPPSLSPSSVLDDDAIRESASAAAEIFRLALVVYIHRIVHTPVAASQGRCPEEESAAVAAAVDQAFALLPLVPDVEGPGTFLGWALVVLGAEIDTLDRRQHIRRRLQCLTLLALNQGSVSQQVLDEVWQRRDAWVRGSRSKSPRCRWQEVVEDLHIDVPLV